MQGFFVHVSDGEYPISGILGMDNSVRISDYSHQFLKSVNNSSVSFLRLSARYSSNPENPDPLVIYFEKDASNSFDSNRDALKLMNTNLNVPNFYANIPGGLKLSINALPEMIDTILTVPLGLYIYNTDDIVFGIIDLENIDPGIKIYLYDSFTGANHNMITDYDYRINLNAGEYANRFSLKLVKSDHSLPDVFPTDSFTAYSSSGIIKINVFSMEANDGILYLFDLSGKNLYQKKIYNEGYYEINENLKAGIYLVSLLSGKEMSTKKIFVLNN